MADGGDPWKWQDDGSVVLGGVNYRFADGGTQLVVKEYGREYSRRLLVFHTLLKAKTAFEAGLADYKGAREKIGDLLVEYAGSEADLTLSEKRIDEFFKPTGIFAALNAVEGALGRFIEEALTKAR